MKKLILILIPITAIMVFISGCLSIPNAPTARLVPPSAVQTSFSYAHIRHETVVEDYDYYDGSSFHREVQGLNLYSTETRSSLGVDNFDFGAAYNMGFVSGDIKFSPISQDAPILVAFDMIGYFNFSGGVGGGLGMIINIVPVDNFEFILSAYEQYFSPEVSSNYSYSYSSNSTGTYLRDFTTYTYGGVEWHLSKDTTLALGGGIIFLSNPVWVDEYRENMPEIKIANPFFFSVTYKRTFLKAMRIKGKPFETEEKEYGNEESAEKAKHYIALSSRYIKLEDYSEAEIVLLEGLSIYPSNYALNIKMGSFQYKKKDYSLAVYYYEKALEQEPFNEELESLIERCRSLVK